jgi:hypothetical protein
MKYFSYYFLVDDRRIRSRISQVRTDPDPGGPKTGSGSPTPEKMAHLLVEVMCEKSLAVRKRRLKARSETDSRKKRAMKRTNRFIAEKKSRLCKCTSWPVLRIHASD